MSNDAIVTVAQSGLDTKRVAAKDYLGEKWVNHPAYRFNPRHSNNPDIFVQARQRYLQTVTITALKDRVSNPAFQRADKYRHSLTS